jgi:tetratricopeptide (TPR) repeat protein/ADP-heptose:LPS heptosyltransferase
MNDILKKKAIYLFNNKNFQNSLNIFLNLLKKDPKSIELLMYIAFNLMQLQRYQDAVKILNNVVAQDKKIPQIFYNLGVCFGVLGKYEEAIVNLKKAISLKKDYFESYIQLGQLLKKINLIDDAIEVYKNALTQNIQKDSINVNISELYYIKKNYKLATKFSNEALNLNPKNIAAIINIANCYMEQNKVENAIIELEKAKSIQANSPMIYNNLGFYNKILGEDSKAIKNYKKAISLDPNLHDAYFNLSHIQLSYNNFQDGWLNYEHRWEVQKKFSKKLIFDKPHWNTNLGYDRLLIWGEQGIGEQLLFSSILNDVISKFKKVIIVIEDKLVKLFKKKFRDIEIYPLSEKISENFFDYHLPIGSLPKFFRNDLEKFPKYIKKIYENSNKQQNLKKKLKCALSWKSTNKDLARLKSIQLQDLKEILLLDGIDFFNIQYTCEDIEVSEFENKFNKKINKNNSFNAFDDLFELTEFIKSCDFVISVSNTNAHLAASTGIPTYLLLPKTRGKYWYWENDNNGKNLWYPSIVKFKQQKENDWSIPVNNLKKYLLKKYIF